jgi:hypothetical protein
METFDLQQLRSYCRTLSAHIPTLEWDRWTNVNISEVEITQIYGWINRDEPKGRDFLLLTYRTFANEPDEFVLEFTTSSRKYSLAINQWLGLEETAHDDCRPFEELVKLWEELK